MRLLEGARYTISATATPPSVSAARLIGLLGLYCPRAPGWWRRNDTSAHAKLRETGPMTGDVSAHSRAFFDGASLLRTKWSQAHCIMRGEC